jgi:hypothetical protein
MWAPYIFLFSTLLFDFTLGLASALLPPPLIFQLLKDAATPKPLFGFYSEPSRRGVTNIPHRRNSRPLHPLCLFE